MGRRKGSDPANKATVIQAEQRTTVIFEMLIQGMSRADIIRHASKVDPAKNKEDWNLSDRQVDNYIARANALFVKSAAIDREKEIGRAYHRYDHIYKNCVKVQDWQRALNAQREIANLLGLNAPTKQDVTSNGKDITTLRVVYDDKPPREAKSND